MAFRRRAIGRIGRIVDWAVRAGRYVAVLAVLVLLASATKAQAFTIDLDGTWEVLLLVGAGLLAALYSLVELVSGKHSLMRATVSHDRVPGAAVEPLEPLGHVALEENVVLLTDPRRYSPRTTEEIEVRDGYYVHSVTREFCLPSPRAAAPGAPEAPSCQPGELLTYYLPLCKIARGALLDNFRVYANDGSRWPTLGAAESCGLVDFLLERMLRVVAGTPDPNGRLDGLLRAFVADLALESPLPGTEEASSDTEASDSRDNLLAELATLECPTDLSTAGKADVWRENRGRLAQLIEAVNDAYIVFAPVRRTPSERVVFTYSYARAHHPERIPWRDRFRYLVGLRPHEHAVALGTYGDAQSYHLIFHAPSEQYIYSTHVELIGPARRRRPAGRLGTVVVGRKGALDFAHVHVRTAPAASKISGAACTINIDSREKPPGLFGIVACIALAQAILIWTVGIFHSHFFPGPDAVAPVSALGGITADLPAVLLALPGILAGWLAAQFTSDRLRVTSLATVNGIIGCAVLAVASTTIAVSKSAGDTFGPSRLLFGKLGPRVSHPTWALLMLLSGWLAVDLLLFRYVPRAIAFARRMPSQVLLDRDAL